MLINKDSTTDAPPPGGIQYFKIAKEQSKKSDFRYRVGACLVVGKSIFRGYNKGKTHPKFANPSIHIKQSVHAELSCLIDAGIKTDIRGATIYVYRETRDGAPAMARPCEHCMKFLKEHGVTEVYYSTKEYPFWNKEYI